MTSEVSICNQALSRLGGNLIISIDDQSNEAKLCKANYAEIRDTVLQERAWTFATKRYIFAKETDLPEETDPNQFAHRFLIPSEVLSIIRASSDPDDRRPETDQFRVEGRYITSDAEILYVKAITRVIDPTELPPMFRQAFAVRLASEICVALTASVKTQQSLLNEYQQLLYEAGAVDGMQGSTERIRSNRYVQVRGAGATGVGFVR